MRRANLKNLIRREVDAQRETIVAKVISDMRLTDFDGNDAGVWVADVEIGSNNFLKDLPVKANRNRFYAQRGQTVLLRRNAQGRYEIIQPGDRLSAAVKEIAYDLVTQQGDPAVNLGFDYEVVDFYYYQTLDGAAPLGVKWGDGVTPFPFSRIVDADGNPVT